MAIRDEQWLDQRLAANAAYYAAGGRGSLLPSDEAVKASQALADLHARKGAELSRNDQRLADRYRSIIEAGTPDPTVEARKLGLLPNT